MLQLVLKSNSPKKNSCTLGRVSKHRDVAYLVDRRQSAISEQFFFHSPALVMTAILGSEDLQRIDELFMEEQPLNQSGTFFFKF